MTILQDSIEHPTVVHLCPDVEVKAAVSWFGTAAQKNKAGSLA